MDEVELANIDLDEWKIIEVGTNSGIKKLYSEHNLYSLAEKYNEAILEIERLKLEIESLKKNASDFSRQ